MNPHRPSCEVNSQLGSTSRRRAARARKARRSAVVVGVGSIGRPLALGLARLGIDHLTLVDPKRYKPRSVETQCEPQDVDRRKVDVVAALTRQAGIRTTSHPCDIYDLPDGIVGEGTLVISCADNARALIRASRMAYRMAAPLLKVNIEPLVGCASIRAYDLRNATGPCAECQLSDRHYDQQRHPRSCDAADAERSTAGSRSLAESAAELAVRVACDWMSDAPQDQGWWRSEVLEYPGSAAPIRSRLEPNPDCRWDHATRWPNLYRLAQSPGELMLHQLIPPAHRHDGRSVELSFDHQVALRGCCRDCLRTQRVAWWVTSVDTPLGRCRHCGGPLVSVPYRLRHRVTAHELAAVLHIPLADWGVVAGAVIQVRAGGHDRSFVIGDGQTTG